MFFRRVAVFSILGASLLPAADPQLLRLAMPDAKAFAGINVDSARNSPFGQYLLSYIRADDPEFREFVATSGFDPRTDLREVLLVSTGQPGRNNGILLARGRFDIAKIVAAAKGEAQKYQGADLITHGKDSGAIAFLDSSTVIAGEIANVKAAIDRRSKSVNLDAALMAKINDLSATKDAWGITTAPLSAMTPRVPDPNVTGALQGDVLKAVQQTSGGVKFGSIVNFQVEAVALTDKDATALADVIRFFVNMAQLNAPANAPPAASLLQSLDVKTGGNVVKVSLAIAENQLEQLLRVPHKRAGLDRR